MFREVREVKYESLNTDLKKYFSKCINYLIKNIRDAIEYQKQMNIKFRKVNIQSVNKKYIAFKDFAKWYNRILNDLVYVETFEEFEKLVNEFENTELDVNTL